MTVIENPFESNGERLEVGFTFAQHKAAGYQGGTDYIEGGGLPVYAACDGATFASIGAQHEANIRVSATLRITIRELERTVNMGRTVKRGEIIGYTSGPKWPHIDATRLGIRIKFETLVNYPSISTASTGTITPLEKIMATTASPFIKIYDDKLKVGYMIDMFAPKGTPAVRLLGTANSLEWRASAPAKAYKATTAEIQREVNERGIDTTGFETRLANFPKGTVLAVKP